MKKLDKIQKDEYNELKKQFEAATNIQCMIRAMLSLERLWQPFLRCTKHLGQASQQMARDYMDGAWQRILSNHTDQEQENRFRELLEDLDQKFVEAEETMESAKVSRCECREESYLYDALFSGFAWFFKPGKEAVPDRRPDLVYSPLDLISDRIIDTYCTRDEAQEAENYVQSPYRKAEWDRIEADRLLTEHYSPDQPQDFLRLKETYQKLWIVPRDQEQEV